MSRYAAAWQAALAAEQQAAFGYTVLGPKLGPRDTTLARTCQAEHEQLRDDTAAAIAAAGVTPRPPQGDYPALYPLARDPRGLAATLEDDCAAAWRAFFAALATPDGPAALRSEAQDRLTASALRATRWRLVAHAAEPVTAFPGILG
jgi:Domain of unknown function (DUF4439)